MIYNSWSNFKIIRKNTENSLETVHFQITDQQIYKAHKLSVDLPLTRLTDLFSGLLKTEQKLTLFQQKNYFSRKLFPGENIFHVKLMKFEEFLTTSIQDMIDSYFKD